MGKTKVAIIDDSTPAAEEKKQKTSRKKVLEKISEGRLPPNAASSRQAKGERIRGDQPQDAGVSEQANGAADRNVKSDESLAQKKSQKPGKAKPRSKKYQEVTKDLDRTKTYPIDQAVEMVKKLSYSKFAGTLEAHVNTAQTGIRGLVSLPYAAGRKLRILAFGKGAEQSGADIVGDEETLENISQGKIDFDIIVVSPDWMPKLTKVAKVLGPKGLMPNPKNGTIVSGEDGLKKTVASFQAGKTEYKTEPKAPVIHLGLGKLSQPTEELSANVTTLLQTLGKTRVKKVTLSPTMGPSVKVDLASI